MRGLTVYSLLTCVMIVPALALYSYSSTLTAESKKTFQQHYRRVRAFKCSLPRPTSVAVTSLQPGVEVAARVYLPPVTVLHRCDAGAGCCLTPGYSCGVVDSRLVNLTFHVTHVIEVPGHKRGSATLLTLQAVNHTRCDCVEDYQPPR